MASPRRPGVYVLGTFVVVLVALVGAKAAKSRVPTRTELQDECNGKLTELEAEVRSLREQLRVALGHQGNSSSNLSHSTAARSSVVGHGSNTKTRPDSCDPPYDYDRHGIKFYHPECLAQTPDCSIPYEYSRSGIKSFKPGCLEAAPSQASCEPAFVFDANGFKQYKPECL